MGYRVGGRTKLNNDELEWKRLDRAHSELAKSYSQALDTIDKLILRPTASILALSYSHQFGMQIIHDVAHKRFDIATLNLQLRYDCKRFLGISLCHVMKEQVTNFLVREGKNFLYDCFGNFSPLETHLFQQFGRIAKRSVRGIGNERDSFVIDRYFFFLRNPYNDVGKFG